MYQEIQGQKAEKKALESVKSDAKLFKLAPIMNFKQRSGLVRHEQNQFKQNVQFLKQEKFKDFQALFYKHKDFQVLEFLFPNQGLPRIFKFCTNPMYTNPM
jgi:hypothetical protein